MCHITRMREKNFSLNGAVQKMYDFTQSYESSWRENTRGFKCAESDFSEMLFLIKCFKRGEIDLRDRDFVWNSFILTSDKILMIQQMIQSSKKAIYDSRASENKILTALVLPLIIYGFFIAFVLFGVSFMSVQLFGIAFVTALCLCCTGCLCVEFLAQLFRPYYKDLHTMIRFYKGAIQCYRNMLEIHQQMAEAEVNYDV